MIVRPRGMLFSLHNGDSITVSTLANFRFISGRSTAFRGCVFSGENKKRQNRDRYVLLNRKNHNDGSRYPTTGEPPPPLGQEP